MRNCTSIALLLLCLCNNQLVAGYKLVWADEFEKPGLPDPSKWSCDVGGNGWGNNELQFYTENNPSNARVEDGYLVIEAHKESKSGMDYTSARLVTKNKGDWLYGRFVIRAKLPRGRGTWPAIWMLPTDWEYGRWPNSGEIDIMEHVGYDMHTVHSTLHTKSGNGMNMQHETSKILLQNVDTAFHTFVTEWTPDSIKSYVDGKLFFSSSKDGRDWQGWPFDKRFHLILNLAVGGNWGGVQGVDPDVWPQSFVIDYVRVYQLDEHAADSQPSVDLSLHSDDLLRAQLSFPNPGVYKLFTSYDLINWSDALYSSDPRLTPLLSSSFVHLSQDPSPTVYLNSFGSQFCRLYKMD